MKIKRRHMLAALHAATALVGAVPALAQDAETGAGSDIIVTARRTEERLQDVPISITAFNQDQLTERNVVSGRDLVAFTPSLQANSRFGSEQVSFSMRGFVQENRTTASVAVYFADVVSPRAGGLNVPGGDGAGPGAFFDLQNVQVLKGPQGTLFGRNTTGGAILLVPQKPKDRFEGFVEGTYGNYDQQRLQAVVNAPLGESARIRIGADWNRRDGFVRNVSGIGPDRFNDMDYIALRASLVVDLTPNLENYTIASFTRSHNNGFLPKVTLCNPASFPHGQLGVCDQLTRQDSAGFYSGASMIDNPQMRLQQWQLINTTTWEVSDTLTIKNTVSYGQLRNTNRTDSFGVQYIIPPTLNVPGLGARSTGALAGQQVGFALVAVTPGADNNDQETMSEELQFQGRAFGDKLMWQAGGYFEASKPLDPYYGVTNPTQLACTDVATFQCRDVLGEALSIARGQPFAPQGSLNRQMTTNDYRNVGVYGQGTFAITDWVKFTAGARYTWDRVIGKGQAAIIRFPAANTPAMYCTDPRLGSTAPLRQPDGSLDFSNAVPIDLVNTACTATVTAKSSRPTWLVGLDFTPLDDVLLYAKYSRGYRQGSANPSGVTGYQTFGPEKVDTYEIGAKTSWRGAVPGRFNVAAFYNDFTDQQISTGFRNSLNQISPNSAIVNAGSSRIQGVEAELSLSPVEGLTLDAGYTYLDAKLTGFDQPPPPSTFIPGSIYDTPNQPPTTGQRLTFSPKHKLVASASYSLPLPQEVGEVTLSATYSYQSTMTIIPGFAVGDLATPEAVARVRTCAAPPGACPLAIGELPPIELVNLNIGWRSVMGSPVDAAFFVTNLFNDKYFTHVSDQRTAGFVHHFLGEPRMYGVRLKVRFGD